MGVLACARRPDQAAVPGGPVLEAHALGGWGTGPPRLLVLLLLRQVQRLTGRSHVVVGLRAVVCVVTSCYMINAKVTVVALLVLILLVLYFMHVIILI